MLDFKSLEYQQARFIRLRSADCMFCLKAAITHVVVSCALHYSGGIQSWQKISKHKTVVEKFCHFFKGHTCKYHTRPVIRLVMEIACTNIGSKLILSQMWITIQWLLVSALTG